jgi:hypothetical protein
MNNTADVTGKPIAVLLQSISGVSAINRLIAFYDIHGERREVLFFNFVLDHTRPPHETRFYVYKIYNILEKNFCIRIALVRNRGGMLVKRKIYYFFLFLSVPDTTRDGKL